VVASPPASPVRAVSIASACSRSPTISAALVYRFEHSLQVARSTIAASTADTSGRRSCTSGSGSCTCRMATPTWLSARNGTSPVSIS